MRHFGRAFEELRRGLEMVSTRGSQFLRLHSAPNFAVQWLTPRLARFLRDHPGIEIRLAAGTDYTRFHNDEFDGDILCGLPRQKGFVVVPLGEELVTPLCTPDVARATRAPMDPFRQVLIESEVKQVRWSDWFARNGLPAPRPQGGRFDRSFLAIAAAIEGLGVALEFDSARRAGDCERAVGTPLGRARRGCPLRRAQLGVPAERAPTSQLTAIHDVAGHGVGAEDRGNVLTCWVQSSAPQIEPA